jgi:hypothetical protein
MSGSMAHRAQRDQILFNIVSQPAARANVVDLKILRCPAVLAAPSIAREHLVGEPAIRVGFKPQPRPLPFELVQDCSSRCPAAAASVPREERPSVE